jgi:hypothetical protein
MTRIIKQMHCLQRAVLRERGCMPARTVVRFCGRAARPSICETPALAKPPQRYTQAGRQCVPEQTTTENKIESEVLFNRFIIKFITLSNEKQTKYEQ